MTGESSFGWPEVTFAAICLALIAAMIWARFFWDRPGYKPAGITVAEASAPATEDPAAPAPAPRPAASRESPDGGKRGVVGVLVVAGLFLLGAILIIAYWNGVFVTNEGPDRVASAQQPQARASNVACPAGGVVTLPASGQLVLIETPLGCNLVGHPGPASGVTTMECFFEGQRPRASERGRLWTPERECRNPRWAGLRAVKGTGEHEFSYHFERS